MKHTQPRIVSPEELRAICDPKGLLVQCGFDRVFYVSNDHGFAVSFPYYQIEKEYRIILEPVGAVSPRKFVGASPSELSDDLRALWDGEASQEPPKLTVTPEMAHMLLDLMPDGIEDFWTHKDLREIEESERGKSYSPGHVFEILDDCIELDNEIWDLIEDMGLAQYGVLEVKRVKRQKEMQEFRQKVER